MDVLEMCLPGLILCFAGLFFMLLGLILKKTVLRLTIYTTKEMHPTVSVGASSIKEGTGAAFKTSVSCRTKAKDAQEILESLGSVLN